LGSIRSANGKGIAALLLVAAVSLGIGCAPEVYKPKFKPHEIDHFDDLYTATAVGSEHLWAAGYFGSIYRTRDGGKSFEKLPADTQKSLYGISFADENNGWVVGRNGYIIHTTNGGDTWEHQSTPRQPAQHIFGIHAIDAAHAWAVGEWGGRYYTEDGGKTWQDRSFTIDEKHPAFRYLTDFEIERFRAGEVMYDDLYLNDVFFADANHGWMIGEYGLIYRTEDGGQNWDKGHIVGELVLDDFAFDEGSSEIPRERWPILFDAAEKLKEKEYLRVAVEGFMTEAELAAANGETVLADGRAEAIRDFLEGEGVSQERIQLKNTTPLDRETVDMVAFARTKVGEARVARIEVRETPFLFDVKFQDPQNGLIAGLGGVILHTADGGRTWNYANTEADLAFFAIDRGSRAAVAVGERGLYRVSHDSANSWKRAESGFPELFGFMRDVAFGDRDHGWIVGASGLVLRSEDGGETWNQVLPGAVDGAGSTEGGE
jgi:photosystem II stability/assembly factor-like uncharacterized protein